MDEFLKSINTNDVKVLETYWQRASQLNLHHSAMTLLKRSLEILLEQDKVLPEGEHVLRQLTVNSFYTGLVEDKKLGQWACNELATSRSVHPASRQMGRNNQIFYVPSIDQITENVKRAQLIYNDLEWNPTNPSIVNFNDELWMIQRTVNYNILPDGRYDPGVNDPVKTENYLVRLNHNLEILSYHKIHNPNNWPDPSWPLVLGFEDCRLFVNGGRLWASCTVREQHPQGLCEIYMFELLDINTTDPKFGDWHHLPGPSPTTHQKNWMPVTPVDNPAFVYTTDPTVVIGGNSRVLKLSIPSINADNYRGGGQVIAFDRGFLAIIHESITRVDGLREYLHRFVKFDHEWKLAAVSDSFKFQNERIEFAAGLTVHPVTDTVIVSYGVNDRESWLCSIPCQQVANMLNSVV